MAHVFESGAAVRPSPPRTALNLSRPSHQAYVILYIGFIVLPIVAGLDKFIDLLVPWEKYLAPLSTKVVPVAPHTFMMIVGVIEIVAGLIVVVRPQIGAYIVCPWLSAIIVNLLIIPGFYAIALRDFGLSLGAIALGRLSHEFGSVFRTN
jgi:hypothetical protein